MTGKLQLAFALLLLAATGNASTLSAQAIPAQPNPATPSTAQIAPSASGTGLAQTPSASTNPRQNFQSNSPRSTQRTSRGNRRPGAPTTAPATPAANSAVQITGDPTQPGKPSDDHPMLPIVSVPNPLGIRSGTPIHVRLQQAADSGHMRNGDTLTGTLAAPLAGLAPGTPVRLTVVQAVQAGSLTSYGELSLQVVGIGSYPILSNIVTALGKEGKKELPDAAPALGTEAEFPANQDLTFPAA